MSPTESIRENRQHDSMDHYGNAVIQCACTDLGNLGGKENPGLAVGRQLEFTEFIGVFWGQRASNERLECLEDVDGDEMSQNAQHQELSYLNKQITAH